MMDRVEKKTNGNEYLGLLKDKEPLELLNAYQLQKMDCLPYL
jgi:hypothetical protein